MMPIDPSPILDLIARTVVRHEAAEAIASLGMIGTGFALVVAVFWLLVRHD